MSPAKTFVPSTLLFVAVIVSSGCSSTPEATRERPLPFKVALLPIRAKEQVILMRQADDGSATTSPFKWAVDGRELEERIIGALKGPVFADAERIDYPPNVSADQFWEEWTEQQRKDWCLAQTRENGADLILRCRAEFRPAADSSTNGNFWPNLLLFLIGGPLPYLLSDRTYSTDATLTTTVYDVFAMTNRDEATLERREAWIVDVESKFKNIDLNFFARAEADDYALSIVCPPGWLASETDPAKKSVSSAAAEALAAVLGDSLTSRSRDLLVAFGIADFYFGEEDILVERTPDGTMVVSGSFLLRRGEFSQRMEGYAVTIGGQRVVGKFEGNGELAEDVPNRAPNLYRFKFRAPVKPELPVDWIRLEAWSDSQRPKFGRMFTFRVTPPGSAGNT